MRLHTVYMLIMAQVSVNAVRGKLRLVWRFGGKRYFLHTGLSESDRINWVVCEQRAKQIEADCITGNFDPTLKKYKDDGGNLENLSIVALFEQFTTWKRPRVYKRTLEKYDGLANVLKTHFKNKVATSLTDNDVVKFRDHLLTILAPSTAKERIGLMAACWGWAMKAGKVEPDSNPWQDINIRVPPKPNPRPFTRDEVERILATFAASSAYSFYLDYVRFLFGTGVRTGEAIGLLWEHVSEDCREVWIGESLSRGKRKETKTNQARTISLPPDLQDMLIKRRLANDKGLVFPSPRGGAIDDHNFRNRAWVKTLQGAGVEYRKPYLTRSTFVSHALSLKMNPVDVAALTGHDVETMYRDYAASIESSPKIPALQFMPPSDAP